MYVSVSALIFIAALFLITFYLLWLFIRDQSSGPRVYQGPFYIILLPTMEGIIHGYCTAILSDHPTFDVAERTAKEYNAEDTTGLLYKYYNITIYDANEKLTYIKGSPL